MSQILDKEKAITSKKTEEIEAIEKSIKILEHTLDKASADFRENKLVLADIEELKELERQLQDTCSSINNCYSYTEVTSVIDRIRTIISKLLACISRFREKWPSALEIPESIYGQINTALNIIKLILNNRLSLFTSIENVIKISDEIENGVIQNRKKLKFLTKNLENICFLIDNNIFNIPDAFLEGLMKISSRILEIFPKSSLLQIDEGGNKRSKESIKIRIKSYFIYKNINDLLDMKTLDWDEDCQIGKPLEVDRALLGKI